MLAFSVLFSLLSVMALAKPLPMPAKVRQMTARSFYLDTPCWENGRGGLLHDAVCVAVNGDLDGTYYDGTSLYADNTPCWLDGRYGLIGDSLCDVVELSLDDAAYPRYTWPYDGNFVDGNQCWLDGWTGTVTGSSCIVGKVDLSLDKRHYAQADVLVGTNGVNYDHPYYRYPYGLADGERCWKDNVQGLVKDALCIVADIGIAVKKRNYINDQFFKDGTPCYENGRLGLLQDTVCVLADVQVTKRFFTTGSPILQENDACRENGRDGVVQDALCVVADARVNKRLLGVLGGKKESSGRHDYSNERLHTAAVGRVTRDLLPPAAVDSLTAGLLEDVEKLDQPLLGGIGYVKKDLLGLGGLEGSPYRYGDGLADVATVLDVYDGHDGRLGLKRGLLSGQEDLIADVEAVVNVGDLDGHHGLLEDLGLGGLESGL